MPNCSIRGWITGQHSAEEDNTCLITINIAKYLWLWVDRRAPRCGSNRGNIGEVFPFNHNLSLEFSSISFYFIRLSFLESSCFHLLAAFIAPLPSLPVPLSCCFPLSISAVRSNCSSKFLSFVRQMVSSSPDLPSSTPDSPNPSNTSHEEHCGDVSGPLCPSTVLSLPEAESPCEIDKLETGGPYPARKLPSLDFAPTYEGSLLGSIHTRIASLRSTTTDAQARYSRAIDSSIPETPVGNRNVRMTVANALWNSTAFFEEEEAVAQLLRYREV